MALFGRLGPLSRGMGHSNFIQNTNRCGLIKKLCYFFFQNNTELFETSLAPAQRCYHVSRHSLKHSPRCFPKHFPRSSSRHSTRRPPKHFPMRFPCHSSRRSSIPVSAIPVQGFKGALTIMTAKRGQ